MPHAPAKLIPAGITVTRDPDANFQCQITFSPGTATNNSSIMFITNNVTNANVLPGSDVFDPDGSVELTGQNGVYSIPLDRGWTNETIIFTGFGSANPFPLFITCNGNSYSIVSM